MELQKDPLNYILRVWEKRDALTAFGNFSEQNNENKLDKKPQKLFRLKNCSSENLIRCGSEFMNAPHQLSIRHRLLGIKISKGLERHLQKVTGK